MPLKDADRKRLDAIVQQMDGQGASPEDIQSIVSDFKAKYGGDNAPTPQSPAPASPSTRGFDSQQFSTDLGTKFLKGVGGTFNPLNIFKGGMYGPQPTNVEDLHPVSLQTWIQRLKDFDAHDPDTQLEIAHTLGSLVGMAMLGRMAKSPEIPTAARNALQNTVSKVVPGVKAAGKAAAPPIGAGLGTMAGSKVGHPLVGGRLGWRFGRWLAGKMDDEAETASPKAPIPPTRPQQQGAQAQRSAQTPEGPKAPIPPLRPQNRPSTETPQPKAPVPPLRPQNRAPEPPSSQPKAPVPPLRPMNRPSEPPPEGPKAPVPSLRPMNRVPAPPAQGPKAPVPPLRPMRSGAQAERAAQDAEASPGAQALPPPKTSKAPSAPKAPPSAEHPYPAEEGWKKDDPSTHQADFHHARATTLKVNGFKRWYKINKIPPADVEKFSDADWAAHAKDAGLAPPSNPATKARIIKEMKDEAPAATMKTPSQQQQANANKSTPEEQILSTIKRLERMPDVPVSTYRLREELGNLSKEEFDRAAVNLVRQRQLRPSIHADPANAHPDEQHLLVLDKDAHVHGRPEGDTYNGFALRTPSQPQQARHIPNPNAPKRLPFSNASVKPEDLRITNATPAETARMEREYAQHLAGLPELHNKINAKDVLFHSTGDPESIFSDMRIKTRSQLRGRDMGAFKSNQPQGVSLSRDPNVFGTRMPFTFVIDKSKIPEVVPIDRMGKGFSLKKVGAGKWDEASSGQLTGATPRRLLSEAEEQTKNHYDSVPVKAIKAVVINTDAIPADLNGPIPGSGFGGSADMPAKLRLSAIKHYADAHGIPVIKMSARDISKHRAIAPVK